MLVEICFDNSSYTEYSTVRSTPASGMYWGRYGDLASASGCETTSWTSSASPPGRANKYESLKNVIVYSGSNKIDYTIEKKVIEIKDINSVTFEKKSNSVNTVILILGAIGGFY